MKEYIREQVSALRYRYPEGTCVRLFGIHDVPDGTLGVIDFIDDVGVVFIETPEGVRNVALSPTDAGTRFVKE